MIPHVLVNRLDALLAAGVILIRIGQMLYLTGMARSKNAGGAGLRALLDFCVVVLAVWAFGMAILSGDWHGLVGINAGLGGLWLQVALVAAIATMIPHAAGFERTKLGPSLVIPAILAGVVVPVCWRFSGILEDSRLHFHDECGASYLHIAGAVWALVACYAVGARTGKRNNDGSSNMIPGHNTPLSATGAMLILAGFLPYIAFFPITSESAIALGNVLLSAATAALAACIFTNIKYGKPDYHLIFTALLGGLVAMTAAPAALPSYDAVITGVIAGLVLPWVTILLDLKFKLDDPISAVAIHGGGGTLSLLLAGVMLSGSLAHRTAQLGYQAAGLLAVAIMALAAAAPTYGILKALFGLRAKEADEYDGLDLGELDMNAYPDFQQTMIKSYHMREA